MAKGILGKKIGMTQIFDEQGRAIPVTAVEAGPCVVVQRKTEATDGYEAVQLGFEPIPERLVNRPVKGHFQRAGVGAQRYLREVRLTSAEGPLAQLAVGDQVTADLFAEGDYVDVAGVTKGRGFAGPMKRWGFRRGPMSHGSRYHRGVGSLGATGVARVFKGRKMPGRLGGVRRTIQGLQVVRVDPENNLLLIRGAIPGPKGGLVFIKETVKASKRKS